MIDRNWITIAEIEIVIVIYELYHQGFMNFLQSFQMWMCSMIIEKILSKVIWVYAN